MKLILLLLLTACTTTVHMDGMGTMVFTPNNHVTVRVVADSKRCMEHDVLNQANDLENSELDIIKEDVGENLIKSDLELDKSKVVE